MSPEDTSVGVNTPIVVGKPVFENRPRSCVLSSVAEITYPTHVLDSTECLRMLGNRAEGRYVFQQSSSNVLLAGLMCTTDVYFQDGTTNIEQKTKSVPVSLSITLLKSPHAAVLDTCI